MIELDSICCSYDEKIILQNISLKIPQHLNILGVNGSGKSTLAKAICSLIDFNGEVKINAKNIKYIDFKDRAKLISYIPPKLEIFDHFIKVYDFVLQGRFTYKKNFFDYSKKDKEIAKQTIEFLNISHLNNHTISSLSSGEQQLCLIAQALTQQSKIIIFDEPTANLDPANSKIIAQHIKALKKYHQIILITHDLNLANFIDSPTLFIKDAKALYYEENFFNKHNLEELYGVAFESLAVKYD